ncbi:MAG: hypothetical protein KDB31_02060 [Microthrixaceae bacterium]|nr:hypothetical protein [Microthrixaceae bacterium]
MQTIRALLMGRFSAQPAWALLTEVFIGIGWLRAAVEKLIDPAWWTGQVVTDFVESHLDSSVGWYSAFASEFVVPAATVVALVVVVAQLVAAAGLISGRRLGAAIGIGIFLNLNFMAAGAVNPSAFYLLAQGSLLLWMAERRPTLAARRGLGIAALVAGGVGLISLPFVSTLHPALVIDDPAVMFVTGGILTVLACFRAGVSVASARQRHNPSSEP